MRELIGFWLVAMTITTFFTMIGAFDDVFDDAKGIIKVLVMVGTMLAMLLIGLYLMGG